MNAVPSPSATPARARVALDRPGIGDRSAPPAARFADLLAAPDASGNSAEAITSPPGGCTKDGFDMPADPVLPMACGPDGPIRPWPGEASARDARVGARAPLATGMAVAAGITHAGDRDRGPVATRMSAGRAPCVGPEAATARSTDGVVEPGASDDASADAPQAVSSAPGARPGPATKAAGGAWPLASVAAPLPRTPADPGSGEAGATRIAPATHARAVRDDAGALGQLAPSPGTAGAVRGSRRPDRMAAMRDASPERAFRTDLARGRLTAGPAPDARHAVPRPVGTGEQGATARPPFPADGPHGPSRMPLAGDPAITADPGAFASARPAMPGTLAPARVASNVSLDAVGAALARLATPNRPERLVIVLEPAALGRVEVEIVRRGGALSVELTVESAVAMRALDAERPSIEAALRQAAADAPALDLRLGRDETPRERNRRVETTDPSGTGRADRAGAVAGPAVLPAAHDAI